MLPIACLGHASTASKVAWHNRLAGESLAVWGVSTGLAHANAHPCCVQVVLSLRLTEAEVEKVVLDPTEYDASQWLEPDSILGGDFHPALKFAVQSLLATQAFRELQQAAAAEPGNDIEIAALARNLVRLTCARPPEGKSDYRVVAPALQYEGDVISSS